MASARLSGRAGWMWMWAALCAGGPVGCTINSRGAAEPMVMSRASTDLDCPQKEIRLEPIELGNRYKAIGCGRMKMYRTACVGLQCTVAGDDEPAIPWRDRPGPDEPHR
ncbi:MAG: hypothetical protein R3B70_48750 [Polyangiaceae bacterium]